MSQTARRRLQLAINRLSLQPQIVAKSARGKCCFCDCEIRPGQEYKRSGRLAAHEFCLSTVATDLSGSKSR